MDEGAQTRYPATLDTTDRSQEKSQQAYEGVRSRNSEHKEDKRKDRNQNARACKSIRQGRENAQFTPRDCPIATPSLQQQQKDQQDVIGWLNKRLTGGEDSHNAIAKTGSADSKYREVVSGSSNGVKGQKNTRRRGARSARGQTRGQAQSQRNSDEQSSHSRSSREWGKKSAEGPQQPEDENQDLNTDSGAMQNGEGRRQSGRGMRREKHAGSRTPTHRLDNGGYDYRLQYDRQTNPPYQQYDKQSNPLYQEYDRQSNPPYQRYDRQSNSPYQPAGYNVGAGNFPVHPMFMPYPDYFGNVGFQMYQQQSQRQHHNSPRESKGRNYKSKRSPSKPVNLEHSAQAGMLREQLMNESYECMVCCERVRCSAAVWSCQNCYHVYHLGCARKWANSASAVVEGEDGGWRCPACQNISKSVPNAYWCFCGKQRDPRWNPREGITPHSCGELCQKKRDVISNCPHKCNQLCHPGPCPSCPVTISKPCECGKTLQQVRCGQSSVVLCTDVCQKSLNCDKHTCQQVCHSGPCGECEIEEKQSCYCGDVSRCVPCGSGDCDVVDGRTGYFSCEKTCERLLDCCNHKCASVCHKGACEPCHLKPAVITHCPCGGTLLADLLGEDNPRTSCLDPIPTCKQICGKALPCHQKQEKALPSEHVCKLSCHHGLCGGCDGVTSITCRCGTTSKEIRCSEVTSEDYLCNQRCNKKRKCGRHRCNQKCCVDRQHKCELICGKKLRCGFHTCEELCHRGHCPTCFMTGFDELTCYCGATVLYPPIPCGTPPPNCPLPCSRQHPCSHSVNHTCHNEDTCPPCTTLTKKMCAGEHELRHNIPCHVTEVSCGQRCNCDLPCGHKCIKLCHKPPCLMEQESCTQPCPELRQECDHSCGAPCHTGQPCPATPCRVKITVKCNCGRRSEVVQCLQGGDKTSQSYQRWTTEALANKLKNVQLGQTVDISGILMDDQSRRHIECNEDCALYERNRRFAEALDIDPNSSPFTNYIPYSPSLLSDAKCNLDFIKSVEEAFESLIKTAAKTQSGQRSHAFSPMNSNQRRIIHEMAVHYNCTSRSYDLEPKRNTVITATKESRIPPLMLSVQLSRQMNPPAPTPVPYLPTSAADKARLIKEPKPEVKNKTWAQIPDYFADDYDD